MQFGRATPAQSAGSLTLRWNRSQLQNDSETIGRLVHPARNWQSSRQNIGHVEARSGKRIMDTQRTRPSARPSTRPSLGRWYILLLISLMYLITYLDRVNISTAAPEI